MSRMPESPVSAEAVFLSGSYLVRSSIFVIAVLNWATNDLTLLMVVPVSCATVTFTGVVLTDLKSSVTPGR